jgi:hypothetical protein
MADWLLLTHQLPQEPAYTRVKVRRRLQQIGAIAVKNAMHVLPRRDDTQEDFEWLAAEIQQDGGDVVLCAADFLLGVTDDEIEARFRSDRDAAYAEIASAADALVSRSASAADVARLRARLDQVARIDYFGAPGRAGAEAKIARLEVERVAARAAVDRAGASPERAQQRRAAELPRRATWVTRSGVFVDRIASAWLIRRFIDPAATFKFVNRARYRAVGGEIRFDMVGGEYTHVGDRCTFETLVGRFGLDEHALQIIGEIVHDVDLKDDKYGHAEVAGLVAVLTGIAQPEVDDQTRLTLGSAVFEGLYASLKGATP